MTSPTTSHIEHLAPTYKILVLIFHSNLTQTRGFIGRFYYDLLMRFGRCLLFWTTLYFCVLCYFRPPPPQQYGHSCHSRRQKVSAMMFTTFYSGDWSVRHKTIAIAASPHTHTHTHTHTRWWSLRSRLLRCKLQHFFLCRAAVKFYLYSIFARAENRQS